MTEEKTIDHVENHVELAQERLLSQFRKSEKLKGVQGAFVDQIQGIEDTAQQLYLLRWVSTAIGQTLDKLGATVDVAREGLSDESYRTKILGEISKRLSSGSNDDIIQTAKNITGASKVIFIEEYPAAFYLDCRDVNYALLGDVQRLKTVINKSRLAGVKFGLMITSGEDAFSFSEDVTGSGFGLDGLPEVGGPFAIEI